MTPLLIVAAVIVVALFAYFTVRASRSPVSVESAEEREERELDEGMIVGDVIPIGSSDDGAVVPLIPIDADDNFDEATGLVEPIATRNAAATPSPATATASPNSATVSPSAATVSSNSTTHAADAAESTTADAREPVAASASRRYDIRWAKRFETPDHLFDDATRLGLLQDLGIVRAPWGVPLLAQAYEEEPEVVHRRAALRSLAAYRHPDTQGTFDVALHSDDEEERSIAEHALTALQIRAALPS